MHHCMELLFFCWDGLPHAPDWLQTQFLDKDDLELLVCLHLPSAGITGCTTTPGLHSGDDKNEGFLHARQTLPSMLHPHTPPHGILGSRGSNGMDSL